MFWIFIIKRLDLKGELLDFASCDLHVQGHWCSYIVDNFAFKIVQYGFEYNTFSKFIGNIIWMLLEV